MDSLRYLINELPDNVDHLKQNSYKSRDFVGKTEDGHLPFALQTEELPTPSSHSAWLYY
jgi:hypothetical protein